jgi:hypothetical protein
VVLCELRCGIINDLSSKVDVLLQLIQRLSVFLVWRQHPKLIALAVRNLRLFRFALKIEAATNHKFFFLIWQIGRKLGFLFRKMFFPCYLFYPEIFIDMKK